MNLDSDLYILFGRKKGDSGTESLVMHEENPKISTEQVNPVTDSATGDGGNFPMVPLIRAHGSLMLIAWPLLGVCGIFFVSWIRPALPKGQWFWVCIKIPAHITSCVHFILGDNQQQMSQRPVIP